MLIRTGPTRPVTRPRLLAGRARRATSAPPPESMEAGGAARDNGQRAARARRRRGARMDVQVGGGLCCSRGVPQEESGGAGGCAGAPAPPHVCDDGEEGRGEYKQPLLRSMLPSPASEPCLCMQRLERTGIIGARGGKLNRPMHGRMFLVCRNRHEQKNALKRTSPHH